jgi:hypothetical protein
MDFFITQGKFKSRDKEIIKKVQEQVDTKWARY